MPNLTDVVCFTGHDAYRVCPWGKLHPKSDEGPEPDALWLFYWSRSTERWVALKQADSYDLASAIENKVSNWEANVLNTRHANKQPSVQ